MKTVELKNNFHHLIDSISNDGVLEKFYSIMLKTKEQREGKLWARLTEEERQELLLTDIESEDKDNLIPSEKIESKHSKWL